MTTPVFTPKAPGTMTDAELADTLNNIRGIEAWIKLVQQEAVTRVVDQGAELPGWRVSLTSTHPKWKDNAKVWTLCRKYKLVEDDFAPRELLKPTQMKELFSNTNVGDEGIKALTKLVGRNPSNFCVVAEDSTRAPRLSLKQLREYRETQQLLE
jgi:hypothetical protein